MAWNEPGGGGRDPWSGKGGDQGPPDLDEIVRKLQERLGAGTYNVPTDLDLAQLAAFLRATQLRVAEALDLDHDSPARRIFLARLQGEVTKRGVIDLLRKGLKHGPHSLDLFYGTPSPGNVNAAERFAANRFSVTRQLRYSRDETRRALDLCLFINGLPIATFELKNFPAELDG